jgi:deazaflavin-dependent oxidoreductase (nitroreductase family)
MHRLGVALLRAVMRRTGRKSSPALRKFIVVMSMLHLGVYRRTRGVLGRRLGLRYGKIVMITTTGRRSGQPRTVPLLAVEDGEDLAVIASHGGLDQPPGWWLNLTANPRAIVESAGRTFRVEAEQADRQKHAELWPQFVKAFPGYRDYRQRTHRELSIMILHPAPGRP